jgi:hypothetical protein
MHATFYGIVFTDRAFVLNPLGGASSNVKPDELSYLGNSGGYAEFARYVQGTNSDVDHYWKGSLGCFVELFRIGSSMDMIASGEMELIANPYSQIQFFPRSVFWTEDILISEREDDFTWQTGFYQRCKHDVDNLGLEFDSDTAEERDLIYDSIPFRMIFNPFNLQFSENPLCHMTSFLYWKNDFYVITQDGDILYATEYSNQTTAEKLEQNGANNIGSLIDSITAGLHNNLYFTGAMGAYLNLQITLDIYGRDSGWTERFNAFGHFMFDYYLEVGFFLQNQSRFCIYFSVDHQEDTLIHPYPEDSTLLYIGIKDFNPAFYW